MPEIPVDHQQFHAKIYDFMQPMRSSVADITEVKCLPPVALMCDMMMIFLFHFFLIPWLGSFCSELTELIESETFVPCCNFGSACDSNTYSAK